MKMVNFFCNKINCDYNKYFGLCVFLNLLFVNIFKIISKFFDPSGFEPAPSDFNDINLLFVFLMVCNKEYYYYHLPNKINTYMILLKKKLKFYYLLWYTV